ncbi:MAG: hypothetical protein Q7T07_02540 [Burkholderiaceae bacterium]|nr:hypothetical protein [Burkholderiaceae bacterium]
MACPVCNNAKSTASNHPSKDASVVDCPQCGPFAISREAAVNLRSEDEANRWKISAWLNEFAPPVVMAADVELALASAVPSLHHRADRMLRWITTEFPPGKTFSLAKLGHWEALQSPDL